MLNLALKIINQNVLAVCRVCCDETKLIESLLKDVSSLNFVKQKHHLGGGMVDFLGRGLGGKLDFDLTGVSPGLRNKRDFTKPCHLALCARMFVGVQNIFLQIRHGTLFAGLCLY